MIPGKESAKMSSFSQSHAPSPSLCDFIDFVFHSEAEAQDQVVHLNHDPQAAFPFLVWTMREQ